MVESMCAIHNVKGGSNRRSKKRLEILKEIIEEKKLGKVYETGHSENYLAELENIAEKVRRDEPQVLVLSGGDATQTVTTTILDQVYSPDERFPILRTDGGGTQQMLKAELDIRKSQSSSLEEIANTPIDDLRVKSIKMIRVRDQEDIDKNQKGHLSFAVGVGFPVEFLKEAYKRKRLKSWAVLPIAARSVISAFLTKSKYFQKLNQKTELKISREGLGGELKSDYDKWLGYAAHSIDSFGIPPYLPQPRIFRNTGMQGKFHAIGTKVDFDTLLLYLPAICFGHAPTYTENGTETKVLELNNQVKSSIIESWSDQGPSEQKFKYHSFGDFYFGSKKLSTTRLELSFDRDVDYIADEISNGQRNGLMTKVTNLLCGKSF